MLIISICNFFMKHPVVNLWKPFLMDFFSIFPEFRKGCWDTTYSSSLTSQHLGNKSSVEAHNGEYFHARLEVAFKNKSHIFFYSQIVVSHA